MTESTQINRLMTFFGQQQDKTKKLVTGVLSYGGTFSSYITGFLDDIDAEIMDRFDPFMNKNIKLLFYRYNDFLISKSLPRVLVRHSRITEN